MLLPPRVLLCCALLPLVSGCREIADTFFVVNAETDELCQSETGHVFAPTGDTLAYTVDFPLGQLGRDLPEGALDTELRLRLFEVDVPEDSGQGVDLSGLETAKVSLRREASPELIRTLLEYSRPSQAFSPRRLSLRGVEAASVPGLGRDERVRLVFEARGPLPTQAWSANLRVCASLRAEVHAFHLIY